MENLEGISKIQRKTLLWTAVFFLWVCLGNSHVAAAKVGSSSNKGSKKGVEEKGHALFLHYCAHCHGIKGEGNGYNSEFLEKEPANLADRNFIRKKTDEQIFRVISLGGTGVKKSPLMPVFGNTLSEEEIWSLIAFIRKLSGDASHVVAIPPNAKKARLEPVPPTKQEIKSFTRVFAEDGRKDDLIRQGEYLFKKKKSCFACHRVGEGGGRVGPDLTRAGFLYKPEWLYTWVRNPQSVKANTQMPNLGLENDELLAITTYMSALKGDAAKIPGEWASYLEAKGDPKHGESLFWDSDGKANCAKCHQVNGKGGLVGPNLSVVGSSRTLNFILESILDPKAVITVGYSSVLILTKEGKFLTGIKKNEDDASLDIVDKEGQPLHVPKDQIRKFKVQDISIMPANFKDILSVPELRDILAYLETLTASMMDADLDSPVKMTELTAGRK